MDFYNFECMLLTYCIKVSGKVEGVFYRQTAREKATALGITGTVKNLESGEVEILATGTKDQLDAFLEWCGQGPPRAVVEKISYDQLSLKNFERFSVVRN